MNITDFLFFMHETLLAIPSSIHMKVSQRMLTVAPINPEHRALIEAAVEEERLGGSAYFVTDALVELINAEWEETE